MLTHFHHIFSVVADVRFTTGRTQLYAYLIQNGSAVTTDWSSIPPEFCCVKWQIHELPVDFSTDPKLRCNPEFIGPPKHSGEFGDDLINVSATSLVLNSVVLLLNESVTIVRFTKTFHYLEVWDTGCKSP